MTEDQQLTALLRLKRYEQPSPGYYQKLLQDIHRRQRMELLRRPLWKIALERMQTFFGEHSMGNLSYASALGAVAVAGLLGISLIATPSKLTSAGPSLAQETAKSVRIDLRVASPSPQRLVSLQDAPVGIAAPADDEFLNNARLFPASASHGTGVVRQPRYVIDARPVSYEATKVSFSF
jgi:hypothetical protein